MNGHLSSKQICGVVLAGGQASRMNFLDKPLLQLANQPLIEYVINNALPQVNQLIISVNRHPEKFTEFQLPLVADITDKFSGPLVGIYSAMKWYSNHSTEAEYLACFPADVPFFPSDIVSTLASELNYTNAGVAWCQTDEQAQPLFSIWSFSLLSALEQAVKKGISGPKIYFLDHPNCRVLFKNAGRQISLMFFNINTLEDLRHAESMLASTGK